MGNLEQRTTATIPTSIEKRAAPLVSRVDEIDDEMLLKIQSFLQRRGALGVGVATLSAIAWTGVVVEAWELAWGIVGVTTAISLASYLQATAWKAAADRFGLDPQLAKSLSKAIRAVSNLTSWLPMHDAVRLREVRSHVENHPEDYPCFD